MSIYQIQTNNVRKTWFLMTIFFLIVIFLGWSFATFYGNSNILYFAVGFSFLMNFFSYWYSDKIVLKISGAHQVTRKTHFDLYNLTENLCITAGLPLPKIYVINDKAPNAFATGRNKNNSAIAVTSGLLEILEKTELEGVIAHELSHIKNKDILIGTIIVVLVGFITLLADFFRRSSFYHGSNFSNDRNSRTQATMLIMGIVLSILAPIFAKIIQLAISRKREFLADASGVLLTRYPEGLAGALQKISTYKTPIKRANRAMAHMYISDPFSKKDKISFFTKLFSTHPPIQERINNLLNKEN